MTHTYKLDQRGIPYRVLQEEFTQDREEKQKPQEEEGILRHGGKLEHFQLYLF